MLLRAYGARSHYGGSMEEHQFYFPLYCRLLTLVLLILTLQEFHRNESTAVPPVQATQGRPGVSDDHLPVDQRRVRGVDR